MRIINFLLTMGAIAGLAAAQDSMTDAGTGWAPEFEMAGRQIITLVGMATIRTALDFGSAANNHGRQLSRRARLRRRHVERPSSTPRLPDCPNKPLTVSFNRALRPRSNMPIHEEQGIRAGTGMGIGRFPRQYEGQRRRGEADSDIDYRQAVRHYGAAGCPDIGNRARR